MNGDDFQKWLGNILRRYYLPIFLGIGGIVLLLYGLIQSVAPQKDSDMVFQSAQDRNSSESAKLIVVDVAGAVENPGVYELDVDARIQDVLIAAGGMNKAADRVFIAKNLNLASKIIDGGKIYIPFEGETVKSGATTGSLQSGGQAGYPILGDSVSGLININSASESELDTLPGIGPVTAGKIIAGRPYEKIEDLVSKKAVGNATFEKIRDKISVF